MAPALPQGRAAEWVAAWAASQQPPEPQNALPEGDLRDATLRQVVRLSLGGSRLRIHLSNAFGTEPLHLIGVHIARPVPIPGAAASSKVETETDRALHFSGREEVTIPAGAEYISDAIEYPVAALSDVAVSIHYGEPPAAQTGHPGSRATSYVAHGDLLSAAELPLAKPVEHWYQLAGIDVAGGRAAAAIVALGDSITDGHGATTNGNDRWTDVLARRLQSTAKMRGLAVLNEGLGGNHLLTDGLGPNALARFDRDVLAQPGVRFLIVLEGVNDLGALARRSPAPPDAHAELVRQMIAAYGQMIFRAHAHDIKTIGATILPDEGSSYYHPGPADEADRLAVNEWIRAAGHFDAVLDYDLTMRDPAHPARLRAEFDSGDHLHPSPAGYAAMAGSIPLDMFGEAPAARTHSK